MGPQQQSYWSRGKGSPSLAHVPTPPPGQEDPLSHFHMDTLLMTTHNLLFGGTETVGTTLRHAFLALMKYPKVQARVQEEIDLAVGGARLPAALEDRSTMPYTDRVIHQVQRFADIIPMNLPHRVTRDTAFRGFLIPKVR
ncbi:PREDICTED: cytochrome P450 2F5-like [Cercocebus atys]|uniref:cytochrome P450 2F5-like n=1 Tax=Cercocebus atys TaxID=9531 RepID=UPI0005F38869|nr:PREDICTED: cytochrome P450 2F5-like [Cercocebus atys]